MQTSEKLIIIKGGTGGIGQACARVFKNNHLIITDYAQGVIDVMVDKLTQEGFEVSGFACDIIDLEEVKKLIKFVAEKGELKALIHTAGVSGAVKDVNKVFTKFSLMHFIRLQPKSRLPYCSHQ